MIIKELLLFPDITQKNKKQSAIVTWIILKSQTTLLQEIKGNFHQDKPHKSDHS